MYFTDTNLESLPDCCSTKNKQTKLQNNHQQWLKIDQKIKSEMSKRPSLSCVEKKLLCNICRWVLGEVQNPLCDTAGKSSRGQRLLDDTSRFSFHMSSWFIMIKDDHIHWKWGKYEPCTIRLQERDQQTTNQHRSTSFHKGRTKPITLLLIIEK